MRRSILALLLGLAFATGMPGAARALDLTGSLSQGGLVIGQVEPGAAVVFRGRTLRVSPQGYFVIGFGRDHGPRASLVITAADGSRARRELEIAERNYDIQRIDGLERKMVTPPTKELIRIRKESAMVGRARQHDSEQPYFLEGFDWPVIGRISGVYGSQRILNGQARRPHFGVDIAAPAGTPVTAPAAGVVRLAHPGMYFSGKTMVIDHGFGVSSTFLHMRDYAVGEGDFVEKGQVVGTVGSTGRSTGPHLDWRINVFSDRIDPQLVVGPMPN